MNFSLDGGAPEMGIWGSKIDSTGSSGLKTGHEQGCSAILHPEFRSFPCFADD